MSQVSGVERMLRINQGLLDNNMQPKLSTASPLGLGGDSEQAQKLIQQAANGGDYRALFQGKSLEFSFRAIAKDLVLDEIDITDEQVLRDDGAAKISLLGQLYILIKEKADIQSVKELFLKWASEAKDGIMVAFEKIAQSTLGVIPFKEAIEILATFIPEAFLNFVGGLVKSILPFFGQIMAVGEAAKDIADYVINKLANPKLQHAATRINANSIFNREARDCCMQLIDEELSNSRKDAIISTASAAVSITGLLFTGNLASMVSGFLIAVAKLFAQLKQYFDLIVTRKKGNAELQKLAANPFSIHPNDLFAAAPILGAHYIAYATQSSLMSFSEASTLPYGSPQWSAECKRVADALSPLRAKAVQLTKGSLIVLR